LIPVSCPGCDAARNAAWRTQDTKGRRSPGSSNGRTRHSGCRNAGSNPAPGSNCCGDRKGNGRACKARTCGFESRPQLHSIWRIGECAAVWKSLRPRSSMDRAPSFYLGTVRVRVLPRVPIRRRSGRRPRSSTDQSGGFRCPRLRVRVAPWTPASAATTAAAVCGGTCRSRALRTRDNVSGLESWPSGKAPRC
jgi:hypothetical protein